MKVLVSNANFLPLENSTIKQQMYLYLIILLLLIIFRISYFNMKHAWSIRSYNFVVVSNDCTRPRSFLGGAIHLCKYTDLPKGAHIFADMHLYLFSSRYHWEILLIKIPFLYLVFWFLCRFFVCDFLVITIGNKGLLLG